MSYRSPANREASRRRKKDLEEARGRLIATLRRTVGLELTATKAQEILEQAKAWEPTGARALDAHIREMPDALTAPSGHCPASLPRLLQLLEASGHGDSVTLLGCATCGAVQRQLNRNTPQGRACGWCVSRTELRPCARCGGDGHIVTRTAEGAICRLCYRAERQATGPCAECGRVGTYELRRKAGVTARYCAPCADLPESKCLRCGTTCRSQVSPENGGPLCRRCYVAPASQCRRCGQIRQIGKRGKDGELGLCVLCNFVEAECGHCGRFRRGRNSNQANGVFLCGSCYPRPLRKCGYCGQQSRSQATWPVGPVCPNCYAQHRNNPAPCALCGTQRVLVGRADNGRDICGPCSGVDIDFACRRCNHPGDIYADGSTPSTGLPTGSASSGRTAPASRKKLSISCNDRSVSHRRCPASRRALMNSSTRPVVNCPGVSSIRSNQRLRSART